MNCRQTTTRLRSSQLAGRMPHGPSSSTFAPGTAARTGEWVATTSWEPVVARSCSSAASPRRDVNDSGASGSVGLIRNDWPSGELEAVPQHLRQGRNARGPH